MTYGDLLPSSVFCFGSRSIPVRTDRGIEDMKQGILWQKTNDRSLSIGISAVWHSPFDNPIEHNPSSEYERKYGSRMFPHTSMFAYLNGMGFLKIFSEQELALIQRQTVTMKVPTSYTRKYGQYYTYTCLVNIPSASQVELFKNAADMLKYGPNSFWLADADTRVSYYHYGNIHRCNGEYPNNILPVIRINDDAPICIDESGEYVIRVPEPEADFTGDLSSLLNWK